MKNKIRLGILGGGGDSLVGILHRIAISMHNKYEIVGGVFNPNFDENLKFAKEIGLDENRIYEDFENMIEEELKLDPDKRMQVVSVLTPNFLHFPMAKKLLENNFNVICEKPMTTSYQEVFRQNATGATYGENYYKISAKRNASSTTLTFNVEYIDADSGDPPITPIPFGGTPGGVDENVDGTITSVITGLRASGSNVDVAFPSVTTDSELQ